MSWFCNFFTYVQLRRAEEEKKLEERRHKEKERLRKDEERKQKIQKELEEKRKLKEEQGVYLFFYSLTKRMHT